MAHNIILIITDTFRYDNIGQRCQAQAVRTPELDGFAADRSTEVTGVYTASFPTIPHRTDVATGRLGWPHYPWQPIDLSSENHIATLLGEKGYATQLICDCPHLYKSRFDLAFDAAFQHRGQEGDRALLRLNDPIRSVMPMDKTRTRPQYRGHPLVDVHRWHNRGPRFEFETFPAKTGTSAIRWMEENHASGPFFLWVDFFDPHEPWDPPEYLVRRYDPDYDGTPMLHPNYGPADAYTPAELHNLQAHYKAEAELVDRWIGQILRKIDDLALWDDSIVVVTSDHGFSIGEHERAGKSNIHDQDDRYWPIYPEVGHVPFLVAGPGIPRGQTLELLAQPMDVLPTLCDVAGVTVDPPEPFQGRSFADALRAGRGSHRDVVVSGCFTRSANGRPVPAKAVTPFVVSSSWGYAPVGARGRPELYNLAADPLATRDLADENGNENVIREIHEQFLAYLRQHDAPAEAMACW